MLPRALHLTRWLVRAVAGLALLLALAAAALWWWTGQEGSLAWVVRQAQARGLPLQAEGVAGSLRAGLRFARVAWEQDGLALEAQDLRIEWQPLALLDDTVQLEQVQAARLRIVDTRPAGGEPPREPASLRLPLRVRVDLLRLGTLAYQGATPVELGPLDARYAYDGRHHRLDLADLRLPAGRVRGSATLQADAPLALDLRLAGRLAAPVPGVARPVPLTFELRVRGPARALEANARLRVDAASARADTGPSAQASARITPFAAVPVPQAHADVQHFDAAWFWPAAPHTLLTGRIDLTPLEHGDLRLQADLRNGAPGPWDQGRLPVDRVRAAVDWRAGTALVESLSAQAAGGTIEGQGRWQDRGWSFSGRLAQIDPARLHTDLGPPPVSGTVQLAGEGGEIRFDAALQAGGAAAAHAPALRELRAQGRWTGTALALAQLRLRTDDALLEGTGEWEPRAHGGRGEARLQAPGLQVSVQGALAPADGQGSAEIGVSDLARAQAWLARWPGLGGLPALRGKAQAHAAWQGGWRDPAVQADARVQDLTAPAGDPAVAPWTLREATLRVRGPLRDAGVELRAEAAQGRRRLHLEAAARAGGGLTDTRWYGRISTLALRLEDPALAPAPWQALLRGPVAWQAAPGLFALDAGEASLQAPAQAGAAAPPEVRLAWNPVRMDQGRLTSSGSVSGLTLAWAGLMGQQMGALALGGDLVFDARWNASLGPELRIDASLARVRGDVQVLAEGPDGTSARADAGVRDLRAALSLADEQLVLRVLWDSERAGHVEGQVRSRLARAADGGWQWPAQAPLEGHLQARLPRIGVWSVLAPPGWRLRGSLSADVRVAGTRERPALDGTVNLDDLSLRSVVDGVALEGGRLRARVDAEGLQVDEFLLRGSPGDGGDGGTLLARGSGRWTPQGPVLEAQAQISHLRASIRGDRQLTVSGDLSARVDRTGTDITGRLAVDRARIRIPDELPPRLGDDVVVRNAPGLEVGGTNRNAARKEAVPAAGGRLALRLAFDLGPDFRVSGRGLDARLDGAVDVRNAGDGSPFVTGVIRAVDGTFRAYGQRLNIDRGELRFTGPAEDPALDILAVRPNMVEKVGVQVTGRAQAPHVELWSQAGLPEAQTLSYVVLGRASAGSGSDAAVLGAAASALLAGKHGTGKGIAGTFGLDDLSVATDSDTGATVKLGKHLANNLYASYERSLQATMGTLFLFYDISRRVTVRAETGARTGVDLILTFYFGEAAKK